MEDDEGRGKRREMELGVEGGEGGSHLGEEPERLHHLIPTEDV